MKKYIGVCLGASTVKFVKIKDNNNIIEIENIKNISHNGNPKQVFIENLNSFASPNEAIVVTGRKFRNIVNLPTISEPEATELAFEYINQTDEKYSSIASIGGETFMVYTLDNEGKINNVITKNQCASGTGEFFLQQIKRMNLSIEEANDLAVNAEPLKVSGRCSVFCKSDCTHALNKGIPKSEVTSGLSLMMAEKIEELIKKNTIEKVLLVGGVTKNVAVINFLKDRNSNIIIPKEADYFEALGAALYAQKKEIQPPKNNNSLLLNKESSFSFLEPLEKFRDKVTFQHHNKGKAKDGDICILGLDVGSTTTKAVIIRQSDSEVLASVYLYTHGDPIKASCECYKELIKQIDDTKISIIGVGTTGSGRHIAGLHALTNGVYNEIVAHAAAAVFFDPEVDTIFEIGGQDAKYTYIVNKVPADYAMNEACSAGTGSFIEESAQEALGIKVTDIEKIALKGNRPPNFSDQCAAFINSDIKTALQENIDKSDVVAGLVYSICLNYVNRVKGNRPVGNKIFMQGGVCYNKAIPIAMAALTGQNIIVPPDPGLMGAFGVALEVKEKISLGLLETGDFNLEELANRQVIYKKPFICAGGKEKCDLKCSINMIEIKGKTYPFGGSCNKYYSLNSKQNIDIEKNDYVQIRHNLMFSKYSNNKTLPDNAKTIGINGSFHTHTLYPLYYNFFAELGYKVYMSNTAKDEGLERELSSFCYPAQLSLGLFQDLIDHNCDYYFLPGIMEMYTEDKEFHKKDSNCTCAFLNTEAYFIPQAFKEVIDKKKILHTIFNYAYGYNTQEDKFIEIAQQLGERDVDKIKRAYKIAYMQQADFDNELIQIGRKALKELEDNPEEFAIVLIGRPYNTFAEIANKGIPRKFASRGIKVIPYDMLDYRNEPLDENQYWESGKKILKAAQVVERNPQLFATYVSNFSCAPDSMIMTIFRSTMGNKPSLTLELDGHTADSGINTRIDAALDIISNYRKVQLAIDKINETDFIPANIEFTNDNTYFISSDGKKVPINDPSVTILIPSMGDLTSRLFTASLRSVGLNAVATPEANQEILKYGRKYSSGKECLPLILCIGTMMEYLEKEWDGESYVIYFIVQGAGDCRLGQYPVLMRDLIRRKKIKNVVPMALAQENGFAGLGENFSKNAALSLMIANAMDDIRATIIVNSEDPKNGEAIFDEEFKVFEENFEKNNSKVFKNLEIFANNINKKIPIKTPLKESMYIALLGEMYVRHDRFANKFLSYYFAERGFILKTASILEWLYYLDYLMKKNIMQPDKSIKDSKERIIRSSYMKYAEVRLKNILEKTGYYKYEKINIEQIIDHSKHLFPLQCRGEVGLTIGTTIYETLDHYCGVINIGPFGCMPTRTSEAVITPELTVKGKKEAHLLNDPSYKMSTIFKDNMTLPFLTIESDGNVYPQIIEAKLETFTLQAKRTAELMKISRINN